MSPTDPNKERNGGKMAIVWHWPMVWSLENKMNWIHEIFEGAHPL